VDGRTFDRGENMNKYIPTERDNKPCQNEECPAYNTNTNKDTHCALIIKTYMHNCKGYQPEQEEQVCSKCHGQIVFEPTTNDTVFPDAEPQICNHCNGSGIEPKQEETRSPTEWERLPFLTSRPIVCDDDLGRVQIAVNNNCDGIQLALDKIKELTDRIKKLETESIDRR